MTDDMKKVIRLLGMALVLCCVCVMAVPVRARGSEPVKMNQLMIAAVDAEVKEMPSADADVIMTFDAGSAVFVTGETSGGWYQISCQGRTGYVKEEALKDIDVDLSALALEMEDTETEGKIVAEEVERVRKEDDRSRVWLIVLGVVMGGILITGILIGNVSARNIRRRRAQKNRKY